MKLFMDFAERIADFLINHFILASVCLIVLIYFSMQILKKNDAELFVTLKVGFDAFISCLFPGLLAGFLFYIWIQIIFK